MGIFYLTLMYFFILLSLDRFKFIDIGSKFFDIPQYLLLLGMLFYLMLGLVNLIIVRDHNNYKIKFKLSYSRKHQGKIVTNLGAGIFPLLLFIFIYPRSATIPFLIGLCISLSIGLALYQHNKNIAKTLPVFTSLFISIIVAFILTPANPGFVMASVFIAVSILLFIADIYIGYKKAPLFIGEKNLYHALFIAMIIALAI